MAQCCSSRHHQTAIRTFLELLPRIVGPVNTGSRRCWLPSLLWWLVGLAGDPVRPMLHRCFGEDCCCCPSCRYLGQHRCCLLWRRYRHGRHPRWQRRWLGPRAVGRSLYPLARSVVSAVCGRCCSGPSVPRALEGSGPGRNDSSSRRGCCGGATPFGRCCSPMPLPSRRRPLCYSRGIVCCVGTEGRWCWTL